LPYPRKGVPAVLPIKRRSTRQSIVPLTGLDTDIEIAYHQQVTTAMVTCDGRAGP